MPVSRSGKPRARIDQPDGPVDRVAGAAGDGFPDEHGPNPQALRGHFTLKMAMLAVQGHSSRISGSRIYEHNALRCPNRRDWPISQESY